MRIYQAAGWLVVVVLLACGTAEGSARRLLLKVEGVPLAWGTSTLEEQLVTRLSRNQNLRIWTEASGDPDQVPFPTNATDLDSLLDWGREIGGRYLLVVLVDHEGLRRYKSFNLPLIVHKWQTEAVVSGEYRLLDLQKGRLLAAEPFTVKKTGSRRIQAAFEGNRHDSKLHLSAAEKSRLFKTLEGELAEHLIEQTYRFVRGR